MPYRGRWRLTLSLLITPISAAIAQAQPPTAPFTDFRYEQPGITHRITVDDLPPPYATPSVSNGATIVPRPPDVKLRVPEGFQVGLYASGLGGPRVIHVAPNGDIFVAESGSGRIRVFRGLTGEGKPERSEIFADHLNGPYGIAFYPLGDDPRWVYVGVNDAVLRFPYQSGDLHAREAASQIARLPQGGSHGTRDLSFSLDGKTLFAAVGSASNVGDSTEEKDRADILAFDPDGTHQRVYASGIRNPSGIAVDPGSGQLWCTVNERDGLGDNLVPDYITSVREGGFYGWPWWYIGAHQDPRHLGKHPELKDKVIVPDVLLQPHNASLQINFYRGKRFPKEYAGDIFATEHGSWNRSVRTGYEVIRIPLHQTGKSTGEYQDFLTGFVLPSGEVWGRPVGIVTAPDGALLVTDDASGSIWRIDYIGH
jgi:glucose/arabinose dehydrogenase